MGKVAKVALPVLGMAGLGFGMAGMGPLAGMMGTAAGSGAASGMFFPSAAAMNAGASTGFSLFSKANLGLMASGVSAAGSIFGGMQSNELARLQMNELATSKAIRETQILQEQNDLRNRHARWEATARNVLPGGGSKRAFLKDSNNTLQRALDNIRITGRASISSFNSSIAQAQLQGRAGLYSGFSKGGRSLLTGFQKYQETRT